MKFLPYALCSRTPPPTKTTFYISKSIQVYHALGFSNPIAPIIRVQRKLGREHQNKHSPHITTHFPNTRPHPPSKPPAFNQRIIQLHQIKNRPAHFNIKTRSLRSPIFSLLPESINQYQKRQNCIFFLYPSPS